MIEFTTGDILRSDAEALVNTVNCVGIMGRGVALQFKNAYPENFKAYARACARNELEPGRMFVFETGSFTTPKYIINFPTKRHWRGKSRIEDIEAGLESLVAVIRERAIKSIALPPLGSGLGGLRWVMVRSRIEVALGSLSQTRVVVFEPWPTTDAVPVKATRVPTMTSGRAALIGLIDRYLAALMDPSVTLLELHKLMYFMQEAGEPLRLKYVKAPYGPFAQNLGHVLKAVEGHYLSGYSDGGDSPEKPIVLIPGALRDAALVLENLSSARERFDRVAQLVQGFETPFGLELLATVHWVATREGATTESSVIASVRAWGVRKLRFLDSQIALAYDVLKQQQWIVSASS